MVFNTSYPEHWSYRIAGVLKAAMATLIYFPRQKIFKGFIENGHFMPDKAEALKMQGNQFINHHLVCISRGIYDTPITRSQIGDY